MGMIHRRQLIRFIRRRSVRRYLVLSPRLSALLLVDELSYWQLYDNDVCCCLRYVACSPTRQVHTRGTFVLHPRYSVYASTSSQQQCSRTTGQQRRFGAPVHGHVRTWRFKTFRNVLFVLCTSSTQDERSLLCCCKRQGIHIINITGDHS